MSLVQSWADEEGRFLQCEFSYHDQSFRVVSLYAPNRNPARNEFLEQIADELDPTVPTLLCGDFNTVFDRSVDRRGSDSSDTWRESSAALKALFESSCCVDAWRYLHPDTAGFSWTRPDGTVSSRIDLIGCPYVWVASMSSCDFVPCPLSDHCALLVSVFVPGVVPPGPGLWKLNASVLGEDGYVQLITSFWSSWRSKMTSFSSLAKWWEVGKREIRQLTKDYCVRRAQETRASRDLLVRLSDHLKTRFDEGLVSAYEPYRSMLSRLAELDLAAAKGAQVRSRIRWVEEGETSSSYFCQLEKKRSVDRWISAIRNPSGRIVSDPHELCDSFSAFYADLFTASPVDSLAQQSLLSNLSAAFSRDQADLCEGYLGVEECREALMGMARNKASGSDGLLMEFYVKFWEVIGSDLVTVLNSCFDAGLLSSSQRRGVISLSFKKGDRLDRRNWRPISLVNVDYKLARRVLAGCLLKVIHLVVADDQTCGVPGRYIGGQIGDAPNSPDSLSGAVVQTPNSVVEGSIGAAPNSSDSLFGAVVQTSNSDLCVDGSNSNSALNIANSKESSNIDKEDINDNVYETSSEGLLSEEESSDNEMEFSGNVVHSDNESSANMEVVTKNSVLSVNIVSPGSNLCGLSVSSGGRPSPSKLPVAVGSKISKAPSAGVHKTTSSRPAGLTPGLRKAALDWGVLSKRRK